MKEINTSTIEQALTMYKETVPPEISRLSDILSQIPERKVIENGRAVRSPYTWLAFAELAMFCSIVLAVIPTLTKILDDPFYQIDKEVQIFERNIQLEDALTNLSDPTL